MSGLEEILAYIDGEADKQINGIVSEADARIEAMREESHRRRDGECDRIKRNAASRQKLILERGRASAELRRKQLLLEAKQELISNVIGSCLAKLGSLPDDEYFDLLIRSFKRDIPAERAELRMNKRDLGRMPESFAETISGFSEGRVHIAKEPVDIDGGFILDFGETEEDMSFSSLIGENDSAIRDICSHILFNEE